MLGHLHKRNIARHLDIHHRQVMGATDINNQLFRHSQHPQKISTHIPSTSSVHKPVKLHHKSSIITVNGAGAKLIRRHCQARKKVPEIVPAVKMPKAAKLKTV